MSNAFKDIDAVIADRTFGGLTIAQWKSEARATLMRREGMPDWEGAVRELIGTVEALREVKGKGVTITDHSFVDQQRIAELERSLSEGMRTVEAANRLSADYFSAVARLDGVTAYAEKSGEALDRVMSILFSIVPPVHGEGAIAPEETAQRVAYYAGNCSKVLEAFQRYDEAHEAAAIASDEYEAQRISFDAHDRAYTAMCVAMGALRDAVSTALSIPSAEDACSGGKCPEPAHCHADGECHWDKWNPPKNTVEAEPFGWRLAMAVLQSDLYPKLAEDERGECDAILGKRVAQVRRDCVNGVFNDWPRQCVQPTDTTTLNGVPDSACECCQRWFLALARFRGDPSVPPRAVPSQGSQSGPCCGQFATCTRPCLLRTVETRGGKPGKLCMAGCTVCFEGNEATCIHNANALSQEGE